MKKKRRYVGMGILLTVFLLVTLFLFYSFRLQKSAVKNIVPKHYEKEYVLIAEDEDSQFWMSVYASALKEAEKNNAYLEWMEKESADSYSVEESLTMAIASKVDAIFIYPDGSKRVRELIQEAIGAGIPVVTLVDDDTESKRISCVGLNAYQLGQMYADEINQLLTDKTTNVEILLDEKDTANNDIIFNQIKSNMKTQNGSGEAVHVAAINISGQNTFDSEEGIRDLFMDEKSMPDILVCLSDVDTQAACQAVVDYNQVGNISIIGYYTSDTVLSALDKGIMQASITPDTDQIGQEAVRAIEEYVKSGYVSEYTSIQLHVVTKENSSLYMENEDDKILD